MDVEFEDPADERDLACRPRRKNDLVGSERLALPRLQDIPPFPVLTYHLSAQPERRLATLREPESGLVALRPRDAGRQLPAVFGGHDTLHRLENGGERPAIILEGLGAVMNLHPCFAADIFIMRRLIGILKAPPATDVEHENCVEPGGPRQHVREQLLQARTLAQGQPALAIVLIGPNDFETALGCEGVDDRLLIVGRVALMLGRHADILRGRAETGGDSFQTNDIRHIFSIAVRNGAMPLLVTPPALR